MKESQVGSQLKGKAGDLKGASPYGRWPVALLLTQPKQPKTLLGYSTHAPWTGSSLQHSWSYGQEAKNMHLGTNILSDAHASLHTGNSHERWEVVNYTAELKLLFVSLVFYVLQFNLA